MKSFLTRYILLAITFLSVLKLQAGIIPTHASIQTPISGAPAVTIGSPQAHKEVQIATAVPGLAHTNRMVQGVVTFGVNHHYPKAFSAMSISVKVKVQRFTTVSSSTPFLTDTLTLDISYKPGDSLSFRDKQSLTFSGLERYIIDLVSIKVNGTSVTRLPENLFIDADMYVDRYYNFSSTYSSAPVTIQPIGSSNVVDSDCDGQNDELIISWDGQLTASSYQLEWVYINDEKEDGTFYSVSELSYDFKHNSTRISTPNKNYKISLAGYGRGYICYRVRGVGVIPTDYQTPVFGVWSQSADRGLVSTVDRYAKTYAWKETMNWQYSATYAEEGKKKEVVSFFDGTLRNRQTVTKVNSDNNTIVGETIYDHQGRPTVQVLPTPVLDVNCSYPFKSASLNYYPNFTQNTSGVGYSRTDFDVSPSGNACGVTADSMGTANGASRYYSPVNLKQSYEQAFVPDAKKYPFSQVEYTPDNTGRIRRQGGVGKEFQLGTGHESKFYYGHPSQLQLDRMFGSEVGDKAHYQKNMVVDPNGQVNVTYLDQEGRTIATALVGDAPNNLVALPSQAAASVTLTEDLLGKDAAGNSASNVLVADGTEKLLRETMLISAPTTVTFNYDVSPTSLTDACLASGICFSCVYDLTIKVYDECGVDRVAANPTIIPTKAGKFVTGPGGVITFSTDCSAYDFPAQQFTLSLGIGSYQVVKSLKINEQARDFYVKTYLDSIKNTCIETLHDFNTEALANTNFEDCDPDMNCAQCLTRLGTLDFFLASGGTAESYREAQQRCNALCESLSPCEASKLMMLVDMSPGGQYGQYLSPNGTTNASQYHISIYNSSNVLPCSIRPGATQTDWRKPSISANGTTITEYRDPDGVTRSRVSVIKTLDNVGATIYIPAVVSVGQVFEDPATGSWYTWPENLQSLDDFVNVWQASWANSLLSYHPEYYFYKTCLEFNNTIMPGDQFTSDSFDSLLRVTDTWAGAVAAGLIKTNYLSFPNVNDRLTNWFSDVNAVWDPFAVRLAAYDSYGSQLQTRFSNYQTLGSALSMAEVAAMSARCPNVIGATPSASCFRFGDNISGMDPASLTAVRDHEWQSLRGIYLSFKQSLQQELSVKRSINHSSYYGYNGCIGNESFNPLDNNFFQAVFPASNSQFFNSAQPCNANVMAEYLHKVKRFATPESMVNATANNVAYQQYLLTGQCPVAATLENLLSEVVTEDLLTSTSFTVSDADAFTGFYLALNNNVITGPVPVYDWNRTNFTATTLEADITHHTTSALLGHLVLTLPSGAVFGWNDILNLSAMHATGTGNNFTITAQVEISDSTFYTTLNGTTTFGIASCSFNQECTANQLANDLGVLMEMLASGLKLDKQAVQVKGGGSAYDPVATLSLQQAASGAATTSTLFWDYNPTNLTFRLYPSNINNLRLELQINDAEPAATFDVFSDLGLVQGITRIVPTGSNTFDVICENATGQYLATLHCQANRRDLVNAVVTPVPMGTCALPTPELCDGQQFDNTTELAALLKDLVLNQDTGTGYNPFASTLMTPNLRTQFTTGLTVSSTTVNTTTSFENREVTTIHNLVSNCDITLTVFNTRGTPDQHLNDITSLSNPVPYGEADEYGRYTSFYMVAGFAGMTSKDTVFVSTCLPVAFCRNTPGTPIVEADFPFLPFNDPCVEFATSAAYANAFNAYNNYIDSITQFIGQKYTLHCMGAVETFTRTYTEKEHHRTLYYYDQAGNLIKTIPPEGVELIAVTNETDAVAVAIKADRLNGTHKVLTNHRLETRYEYNSLGQLERQSVPDQDKMDIWEITLPNGLYAGLNTTAIQMVNETEGYLSGSITLASGVVRGFLYRTENGGTNWTKVNNTVAANINRIAMATTLLGFAVGENGVALQTIDGGTTWDMLNLYGSGLNFTGTLTDVICTSATAARFVSEGPTVITIAISGTTATPSSGTLIVPAAISTHTIVRVNAVEYDGTNYFYAVTLLNGAQQYDAIIKGSALNSMTLDNITGTRYKAISYYSATDGIAMGEDGDIVRIYTSTGTTHKQTAHNSGITNTPLSIFFINAEQGIGLFAAGSSTKGYYTLNGGTDWLELSGIDGMNALNLVTQTTTDLRLMAAGANGATKTVFWKPAQTPEPSVFNHTSNTSGQPTLKALAVVKATGQQLILAGATDGKIYVSNNLATGTEPVTYALIGQLNTSNTSETAVKIVLHRFSTGAISGVIVSSAGKLYSLHRNAGSSAFGAPAVIAVSGGGIPDFRDAVLEVSNTDIFAFDNALKAVHRMHLIDAAPVGSTSASTTTSPSLMVNAIGISSGRLTVVCDGGLIRTSNSVAGGGNVTLWTGREFLEMTRINELRFISGTNLIAVGDNGRIIYSATTGSWNVKPMGTAENLYGIANAGANQIVVGAHGYAASMTSATTVPVPLMTTAGIPVSSLINNDLRDIAVSGGTTTYIVGTNGTLLYSPNSTTTPFLANTGNFPTDFYAVTAISGGPGIVGGSGSMIYKFQGTVGTQQKGVFSKAIRDVHFADLKTGTLVGTDFFVRQTTDGGQSWKVILPTNNVGTQLTATINTVWTQPNGFAILAGVNYFATVNTLRQAQNATFNGTVNDMKFHPSDPLAGYMSLSNGNIIKMTLAPVALGYTVSQSAFATTLAGTDIKALHLFAKQSVTQPTTLMAVGSGNAVKYWNGTAWLNFNPTITPASTVFNDVFFHDDVVGYVVADAGIILRTQSTTFDPLTHVISALSYQTALQSVSDRIVTAANQVNIKCIAFASRYEGIWGGNYTSFISPSQQQNTTYVRKVYDGTGEITSRFFYDRLGRIVVSQNSRQYALSTKEYSYTLYDALGRVTEAGIKRENTDIDPRFSSIFGATVGGQFVATVIDDAKLAAWLNAAAETTRKEVTQSYYDRTVITGLPVYFTPDPLTQRKRIVHTTYSENYREDLGQYDHATHYMYDIHGNVKTLIQDNRKMSLLDANIADQRFKRMDYNYDLISGNVHRVDYETGNADQWHHAYTYDADNRIKQAYTTSATPLVDPKFGQTASQNEPGMTPYWDREAIYTYYDHGPLARVELGQEKVQGLDYTYTLQGWIKAVNSNTLDPTRDQGKDGVTGEANALTARDAYGYSLHYHSTDYKQIGTGGNAFIATQAGSGLLTSTLNFFNGNIGAMIVTITDPNTRAILPLGTPYRYDQLNRLVESASFNNLNLSTNTWGGMQPLKYNNKFTYDANGNITSQERYGSTGLIDNLTYRYDEQAGKKSSNRLYHINDGQSQAVLYPDDIDDQGVFNSGATVNTANNYGYDKEGRLIRNNQEQIATIIWRVDGKVKEIQRTLGSNRKNLKFEYDAMGNRIAKHVLTQAGSLEKSTYYILDASGNVMSVYERTVSGGTTSVSFAQAEKHIYGSQRLGVLNHKTELLGTANDVFSMTRFNHIIGEKNYELTNHLRNVNTVISDKPVPHAATPLVLYSNNFSSTNDWGASGSTVMSLNGGRLQGSNMSQNFNLNKQIPTIPGRVYRFFFSVDPNGEGLVTPFVKNAATYLATLPATSTVLTSFIEFTAIGTTTTVGVESSVTAVRTLFIDDVSLQELPTYVYSNGFSKMIDFTGTGTTTLSLVGGQLQCANMSKNNYVSKSFTSIGGHVYRYYFTLNTNSQGAVMAFARNGSGGVIASYLTSTNVSTFIEFVAPGGALSLVVESLSSGSRTLLLDDISLQDMSIPTVDYFMADIRQASDYSAFGVQLQGRNLVLNGAEKSDRGYQGSEMDNEIAGEGNSYTTKHRFLDTRGAHWWTLDPVPDPSMSPYNSMDNNPIRFNDPLGIYTERRANRLRERAERKGFETSAVKQLGNGKRDFGFNINKDNADGSGFYSKTMVNTSSFKMDASNFTSYSEFYGGTDASGGSAAAGVGILGGTKMINDLLGNSAFMTSESYEFMIRKSFKSATTIGGWSALTKNQQAWRTTAVVGKGGASLLRVAKAGGTAAGIFGVALTSADMIYKVNDNDPSTNITVRDGTDLGFGIIGTGGPIAASFGIISNPIGWGLGIAGGLYGIATFGYENRAEIKQGMEARQNYIEQGLMPLR